MSKSVKFFLMIIAPMPSIMLALLALERVGRNRLGWYLLVFAIACPVGAGLYYFIHGEPFWKSMQSSLPILAEKGDRSVGFILSGFLAVFFAPPLERLFLSLPFTRGPWMPIGGLGLTLLGMRLLMWARIHICKLVTEHVEMGTGPCLVTAGSYRSICRPEHSGFILVSRGLDVVIRA